MNRNLDGIYFRVKRGLKYENICFSDLTEDERIEMCKGRSEEWLTSLTCCLAERLRVIGDQFDIVGE